MASVFLSFSHDDKEIAAQVADALRRYDVDTFDFASVSPGASVSQAIDEGIERADAVFFLISKSFAKSEWANIEVGAAMAEMLSGRTKLLVPVLIDKNVDPDRDVPSLLQRYQWLDLRNGIDPSVVGGLARSLKTRTPASAITEQLDAEEALLELRKITLANEQSTYAVDLAYATKRSMRDRTAAAFLIGAVGLASACVAIVGGSRGVDVASLVAVGGVVGAALGSAITLILGNRAHRIDQNGVRRDRRN